MPLNNRPPAAPIGKLRKHSAPKRRRKARPRPSMRKSGRKLTAKQLAAGFGGKKHRKTRRKR